MAAEVGIVGVPEPTTICEIDVLLVAAHWRRLHAHWSDAPFQEDAARAEIDALLERRIALAAHGGTLRARMARRSAG